MAIASMMITPLRARRPDQDGGESATTREMAPGPASSGKPIGTTPRLPESDSTSGWLTSSPSISRRPIGSRIRPPATRKESRVIANRSSRACPHQQAASRVNRKVSTAMRLI